MKSLWKFKYYTFNKLQFLYKSKNNFNCLKFYRKNKEISEYQINIASRFVSIDLRLEYYTLQNNFPLKLSVYNGLKFFLTKKFMQNNFKDCFKLGEYTLTRRVGQIHLSKKIKKRLLKSANSKK